MYYFLNNNINFHNYIEKTLVMSRQFFTIYYVFIHFDRGKIHFLFNITSILVFNWIFPYVMTVWERKLHLRSSSSNINPVDLCSLVLSQQHGHGQHISGQGGAFS